ncbi:hypothetical protein ACI1BE_000487 [Cronobacter turicensis]
MRYALISDGVVINVIEWDGEGDIFSGYELVPIDGIQAGIGWTYSNGEFKDPEGAQSQTDSELYDAELSAINSEYNSEKELLAKAFLNAILFDGDSEQQKKEGIYDKLHQLNARYLESIQALDEKYGE